MQQYRRMLALPGVRSLMILMFFARMPTTAAGLGLTLHVAVGMDRGYGQAGLVGGAMMVGIAVGAPFMGRFMDSFGLRKMLVIATTGQLLFWSTAQLMSYPVLLVAAFLSGVVVLPSTSIGRQALAVLVPDEMRRPAYSMDSISVEMTFMVGPMLAVLVSTQVSTSAALTLIGVSFGLAGLAIGLFNPPIRSAETIAADRVRIPRREWVTPQLLGIFVIATGAMFVLAGTEVTAVAALRETGQLDWTGLVIIAMCVASAVGGFVHGAVRRSLSQVTLMGLLGLLVIPVGLAAGASWWVLAIALIPMNLMCAPVIAATGENVVKLVPAGVRGEAMGLQSSAFTLGAAIGSPFVGFVVDHSSPAWGFAVAGLGGLLVAGTAAVLTHRRRTAPIVEPAYEPST